MHMCILTCLCGVTQLRKSEQLCGFFPFLPLFPGFLGAKTRAVQIEENPVLPVFCKIGTGIHFGKGSLG